MEEIKNNEILETVRNVRLRKSPKTGKIEVLFLKRENGLYEFPGGKVFDSAKEFKDFRNMSKRDRYIEIDKEARRETEEEIMQNIDNERLSFLGKHQHVLDKGEYKFKNEDEISFKERAITYLVSWQDDPNRKIDLSNSDDGHIEYEWMPLEELEEIMVDDEVREYFFTGKNKEFNRNSDITKLEKSVIKRVKAIVRRFEGQESRNFMDEIIENDYIESDVYRYKEKINGEIVERGEQINMFDFNKFELLSGVQRKRLFEKYWGKLDPSYKCREGVDDFEKSREKNKEILDNFNWTLEKAFKYVEEHVGRTFPSELAKKFPLKDKQDIIDFLNGFGHPEWTQQLVQLFKIARTYLHFKERAPYAFDGEIGLANHAKGFGRFFRGIFTQKGRKFELLSVGNDKRSIKIESMTAANEKAEYRVIDKLITKPDLEFDNVKDIFRGRVVCDSKEFSEVARTLKSKYKSKGIILKDKGETKNKNRGMIGVRYLVGEYPIEEKIHGKLKKFMVPFEIQIIDSVELASSESGTKHHDVYAHKNNLGPRNTKVFGGTSKNIVEEKIDKHAHNPLVQNANNRKMTSKQRGKKVIKGYFSSRRVVENTRKELRENAFNKIGFYTMDNKFIAYQEVIKNWGKPTRNDEWENRMVSILNQRTKISLKKEEWNMFFLSSKNFTDNTIYKLETKGRDKNIIESRIHTFRKVVNTLPGIRVPIYKDDIEELKDIEIDFDGIGDAW